MKRWHAIPAYGFVCLGVLHTAVTFFQFTTLTEQALWFGSAALALFFCGALNLILFHNPYNVPIKRLTIAANVAMTTFVLFFGLFTLKRNLANPLAWLLTAIAVAALLVSIRKPGRA